MISPTVPAWKKWLMLVFVLGLVLMTFLLYRLKSSSRGWDPNQAKPVSTRPAR